MNFFQQLFGKANDPEMANLIQQPTTFLVDVRSPGEFAGGHVAGSVNIPLDTITASIGQFKNKQQIVVFCLSGGRSSQAKRMLNQLGFENVTNGGAWKKVQAYQQQKL